MKNLVRLLGHKDLTSLVAKLEIKNSFYTNLILRRGRIKKVASGKRVSRRRIAQPLEQLDINVRALTGRKNYLNKIKLEYLSPLAGLVIFISHYPEAALRYTSLATGYFLAAASRQKNLTV